MGYEVHVAACRRVDAGRIFCWLVDSGGSHSTKCWRDCVKYMLLGYDNERAWERAAKPNPGRHGGGRQTVPNQR
jgi:hypothetical protein